MPRDIGPDLAIANNTGLDNPLNQARVALPKLLEPSSQQVKENLHKPVNGLWKLAEKFLEDKWIPRKGCALGNETAEGLKHLIFAYLPTPLAWPTYGVLWSLAIVATSCRALANAKFALPQDKMKAGLKMFMHDGIAAIGLPTAWIRLIADPIQKKLYKVVKLPKKPSDFLRSIINVASCYFLIGKLDKPAKKWSADFFRYANDHHKKINEKPSPQLAIYPT